MLTFLIEYADLLRVGIILALLLLACACGALGRDAGVRSGGGW